MSEPLTLNEKRRLDLNQLAKGMPAITPPYDESLAEAAATSLEKQGHRNGTDFVVQFDQQPYAFLLDWTPTTEQARMCYADPLVAVEQVACAIRLLIIRDLTDYSVVERSVKTTGIDYWLGSDDGLFQKKARLEVSGIGRGDEWTIRARVKKKVEQSKQSDVTNLPAIVAVVEFGTPTAILVKR